MINKTNDFKTSGSRKRPDQQPSVCIETLSRPPCSSRARVKTRCGSGAQPALFEFSRMICLDWTSSRPCCLRAKSRHSQSTVPAEIAAEMSARRPGRNSQLIFANEQGACGPAGGRRGTPAFPTTAAQAVVAAGKESDSKGGMCCMRPRCRRRAQQQPTLTLDGWQRAHHPTLTDGCAP